MEILVSPIFEKHYKKLLKEIKEKAKQKEAIFKDYPCHLSIRTHKLSGEEKEAWAFWVDYRYRIKFIFLTDKKVLFLDIGTHKIYK